MESLLYHPLDVLKPFHEIGRWPRRILEVRSTRLIYGHHDNPHWQNNYVRYSDERKRIHVVEEANFDKS